MTTVHVETTLSILKDWTIALLPEEASLKLPSRGQVFVTGTINGYPFEKVLEPDGRWSHWFRVDPALQKAIGVKAGDTVTLEITPSKQWPEPTIPEDFAAALQTAPESVKHIWPEITPMARWEWIRWVNETNNRETRERRVEVSMSKMKAGKRRPCCFNLAACTDPYLSKSGRLMEVA